MNLALIGLLQACWTVHKPRVPLPVSKESLPLTSKVLDTVTLDTSAPLLSNLHMWTCCEFPVCGIVDSVPFFLTGVVLRRKERPQHLSKKGEHLSLSGKISLLYDIWGFCLWDIWKKRKPRDGSENSVTMSGLCENWDWYSLKQNFQETDKFILNSFSRFFRNINLLKVVVILEN